MPLLIAQPQRALSNNFEGLIQFSIAVLVVTLGGQSTLFIRGCAWADLAALILYVPAYALGLNPWRLGTWAVGWFATLAMILAALI